MSAQRIVLICLAIVMLLAPGAQGSRAQPNQPAWTLEASPDAAVDLAGVSLVDVDRAWAVGRRSTGGEGVIYRLDRVNGRWEAAIDHVARAPLNAVAAITRDEVWAVGARGLILYRASGTWHEVPGPVPAAELTAIQMLNRGAEGWVGGYLPAEAPEEGTPVMLRFLERRWEQEQLVGGRGRINGLSLAGGSGWAVGTPGLDSLRYQDGAWARDRWPPNCPQDFGGGCIGGFEAVHTLSPDEAWAVGNWIVPCSQCRWQPSIARYSGGGWQRVEAPRFAPPPGPEGPYGASLFDVAFAGPGFGLAVGVYEGNVVEGREFGPIVLRYSGGSWRQDSLPQGISGALRGISISSDGQVLAVGQHGLILSTTAPAALPPGANPTTRVEDPRDPAALYFPEVGHTLRDGFREYWEQHGGLMQFGFPLTEEFVETSPTDGKPYTVQYFERNRFEYHPENNPPHQVLLGLLGHTISAGREQEAPFQPLAEAPGGAIFFPETRHTLAPEFVSYWRDNGGLAVYGFPISEPFLETSPTDGKEYLVQYFERNRFEHHPENRGTRFEVLLGLLGVQVLQERGWIP